MVKKYKPHKKLKDFGLPDNIIRHLMVFLMIHDIYSEFCRTLTETTVKKHQIEMHRNIRSDIDFYRYFFDIALKWVEHMRYINYAPYHELWKKRFDKLLKEHKL